MNNDSALNSIQLNIKFKYFKALFEFELLNIGEDFGRDSGNF